MRIRNVHRVSTAINALKGRASFDDVVDRLSVVGGLEVDRSTLHRLAKARSDQIRILDTPEKCVRLYLGMMIVACDGELDVNAIASEGSAILGGLVGDQIARSIFGGLKRALPNIGTRAELAEFLTETLKNWLPEADDDQR